MRVFLVALAIFLMSTPAVSQTFVRGNSRIIFENGPQFLKLSEEKHPTQNSTHIDWSWRVRLPSSGLDKTARWAEVGFNMKNVSESRQLLRECIKVLEMQGLGSGDKIVHDFGGIEMKRTGLDPEEVQLRPQKGGHPITGGMPRDCELRLNKSLCYKIDLKLHGHTPLLGN